MEPSMTDSSPEIDLASWEKAAQEGVKIGDMIARQFGMDVNDLWHVKILALIAEIRKRDAQLRFASGYISGTPQFSNKHPSHVLEWIQNMVSEVKK